MKTIKLNPEQIVVSKRNSDLDSCDIRELRKAYRKFNKEEDNEHQGLDEFYHIHNEKDKNSYSWYEIEKTIWILRQYKNLIQKENEK